MDTRVGLLTWDGTLSTACVFEAPESRRTRKSSRTRRLNLGRFPCARYRCSRLPSYLRLPSRDAPGPEHRQRHPCRPVRPGRLQPKMRARPPRTRLLPGLNRRRTTGARPSALSAPTTDPNSTAYDETSCDGGGTDNDSFCDTHSCIDNFDNETGYIVQCNDGEWSHSGGRPGACSYHGGESDVTVP